MSVNLDNKKNETARHYRMIRNLPLVSVILPCYNCSKYIEEAILSIINQTYKNLEIIITDDCSTDNSLQIIESLAKIDNRIIVIKNRENLKLIKTLNNMIDMAHGKYIARMDGDDISMVDRISRQVSFLERHNDFAVCGCQVIHIDENNNCIKKTLMPGRNTAIQSVKYYRTPFYHPSVMIRKGCLSTNPYNETYIGAEDYGLWLKILKNHKGHNLSRRLLKYRIHQKQISQSNNQRETINTIKNIFDKENIISKEEIHNYAIYFVTGRIVDKKLLMKTFISLMNYNQLLSPIISLTVIKNLVPNMFIRK
jgi:glycosyltransferase involved in cell wall biosynthesis